MTVAMRTISGPLEDEARQKALFEGTLLIFKNVEHLATLCSFVDSMICEAFGTEDPARVQFGMEREDYLHRVEELQKRFRGEERTKTLLRRVLEGVGVDPTRSFWDRPHLRVSPHGDDHENHKTQRLGFHRDTWASNVYSQTNWWTPIYPITAGRAIAFFPQYWGQPLKNTSAGWDLEEVKAGRIAAIVPEPTEPVDTSSELRIVIEPRDLLCFSGTHLHASVPNYTGLARFSIEVRSADVECEADGRGAPNLEGKLLMLPSAGSGAWRTTCPYLRPWLAAKVVDGYCHREVLDHGLPGLCLVRGIRHDRADLPARLPVRVDRTPRQRGQTNTLEDTPLARMPASGYDLTGRSNMNHDDLQVWLDAYVDAWRSYDPAAIGALFAEDATYAYHPYDEGDEVVRGREAIVADWLEERDEPGTWEAHYHPLVVEGHRAVAQGTTRYTNGDFFWNLWTLRFDDDNRCTEFVEWFMTRPHL